MSDIPTYMDRMMERYRERSPDWRGALRKRFRWMKPPGGTFKDCVRIGGELREMRLLKLRDSHGGDWDEWPADLRVRQFPTIREAVHA